jgi:Flp pilus assembly protein TadD
MFPGDPTAAKNTGAFLLDNKRFAEAVAALQPAAAEANPKDGRLSFLLGRAFIHSGDTAKAIASMDAAATNDTSPGMMNDVAYELAEASLHPCSG